MPSSCGTFVYRDVTSTVTKSALVRMGGTFSIRLGKCFVSLMCDGRFLARGWMPSFSLTLGSVGFMTSGADGAKFMFNACEEASQGGINRGREYSV